MDEYNVTGMSCASCVAHVQKAVAKLPDVDEVEVNLLTNSMTVSGSASPEEVISAVEGAGYGASLSRSEGAKENTGKDAPACLVADLACSADLFFHGRIHVGMAGSGIFQCSASDRNASDASGGHHHRTEPEIFYQRL